MNQTYPYQLAIGLTLLAFVVLVIVPRLRNFFELQFLRGVTRPVLGEVDHTPGPIISKQSYIEGSKSVQRALAYGTYANRWNLKVIEVSEPIEKAIRVVGHVTTPAIKGALVPRSSADSKEENITIKLEIDVKQRGVGCYVTWHFYPDDPALFERQAQISDFRLNLLLARTNYHIMHELGKKPPKPPN
jgi:hypothetical protein